MSELANKGTQVKEQRRRTQEPARALHPAWRELIRLCADMGYGEIDRLKIHDGLPIMAEVVRQKFRLIPP